MARVANLSNFLTPSFYNEILFYGFSLYSFSINPFSLDIFLPRLISSEFIILTSVKLVSCMLICFRFFLFTDILYPYIIIKISSIIIPLENMSMTTIWFTLLDNSGKVFISKITQIRSLTIPRFTMLKFPMEYLLIIIV